jgi:hypothetical protein
VWNPNLDNIFAKLKEKPVPKKETITRPKKKRRDVSDLSEDW